MKLTALGDTAVVLELSEDLSDEALMRVRMLASDLAWNPIPGVLEAVPAFGSVAVYFDPSRVAGMSDLWNELLRRGELADSAPPFNTGRLVEIPVCYGDEFGPDIGGVAALAGTTESEVIALHCGAEYRVQAIGFSPGFPYLGGLSERLHTPRRATPRVSVPAGSVGIGGGQTGVYPMATPGGWNLIGRTPLRLFRAEASPPSLLGAGDRVRFRPIPKAEFQSESEATPAEARSLSQLRQRSGSAVSDRGKEPARDRRSALQVVRAGPLTTVQDLGRPGHRAAGVPLSGAADRVALRIANLLVGNPEGAAALECTLVGPELVFPADTIIAVGGAGFDSIPAWQPVAVRAGERIAFGPCRGGCRAYVAIGGGIDVPEVLGSRSTFMAAGLGGFHGRALGDGDLLALGAPARSGNPGHWHVDSRLVPEYAGSVAVRVLRGAQAGQFQGTWTGSEFTVTRQFDRMGMRLSGPLIVPAGPADGRSSAVAPGTIQVPGDGAPIVLLADAQTIGGYPKLAHVIEADLPLVAQLRAGDRIQFQEITLAEAHAIRAAREHGIALLKQGLAQKYGGLRTED